MFVEMVRDCVLETRDTTAYTRACLDTLSDSKWKGGEWQNGKCVERNERMFTPPRKKKKPTTFLPSFCPVSKNTVSYGEIWNWVWLGGTDLNKALTEKEEMIFDDENMMPVMFLCLFTHRQVSQKSSKSNTLKRFLLTSVFLMVLLTQTHRDKKKKNPVWFLFSVCRLNCETLEEIRQCYVLASRSLFMLLDKIQMTFLHRGVFCAFVLYFTGY